MYATTKAQIKRLSTEGSIWWNMRQRWKIQQNFQFPILWSSNFQFESSKGSSFYLPISNPLIPSWSRNYPLRFQVQQSQEQLARSIELTKEQMPELLQRIRRIHGTYSGAHLHRHVTGIHAMQRLRFRKRLKVAQGKVHFATFTQCHGNASRNITGQQRESLWHGQQAQPLLYRIRTCRSKWYETVVFSVTDTHFVPTIAGRRRQLFVGRDSMESRFFAHQLAGQSFYSNEGFIDSLLVM